MAGSKAGGAKTAGTIKAKYGDDFYKKIGSEGGKKDHTGGFFANRELARIAGIKDGKISRRGPAKPKEEEPIKLNFLARFLRRQHASIR